jgi:fatty acid desaturase
MSEKIDARHAYEALRQADLQLEKRFPILKHQDAIGFSIFAFSATGMVLNAVLYFKGILPGWATLVMNAILASLLHELEHDLIHRQYFKGSAAIQNFMEGVIWALNGNTVNPWYRKKLHLLHHKESGQSIDIEERLLGNGMPWGLRRLLITVDNTFVPFLILKRLFKEIPQFESKEFFRSRLPVGFVYTATWLSFVVLGISMLSGHTDAYQSTYGHMVTFLMVTMMGPNMLRQSSLAFISSNCHYYGIERMNLSQQGQVLNHWIFAPLHLFCFNFGSTHIIHHFYVAQAFYRRQLFAKEAHRILREAGVRFNDLQSLAYANAWTPPVDALDLDEAPLARESA